MTDKSQGVEGLILCRRAFGGQAGGRVEARGESLLRRCFLPWPRYGWIAGWSSRARRREVYESSDSSPNSRNGLARSRLRRGSREEGDIHKICNVIFLCNREKKRVSTYLTGIVNVGRRENVNRPVLGVTKVSKVSKVSVRFLQHLTRLTPLLHSVEPMKFVSVIVMAAALSLTLRVEAEAVLVNGVEAVVHDSIVTVQEIQDMTEPYVDDLRRQYGDRPDLLEQKVSEAAKQNLDQLIERQVILHEFDTAGYNLPESIIDQQLDDYIKSKYGDRVTLTKTLQQEGITFEKFRQQFRDRFIVSAMREKNINKEIMISPHKVEAYYLDHKDDFKEEDKVKLRMIVLTNSPDADTTQIRKLAEEILQRLKDGASFADMATIYSQGSQQREHGDWGWIDKSVLRKELADVAFQLKPGERSGVVETPNAFYIMLVEDRHPAHVKDLSEVRDEIEKILLEKEHERLQKEWIDKLRKKTFIRTFPY